MQISDREVYEWLLLSNRYAKTRNNHLEPSATFEKTIEVLSRWDNKQEKLITAKQILSELSFDVFFVNEAIEKGPQAKSIENSLRQTYCDYAKKLGQIIDPKKQDKEVQKQIDKIVKGLGPKTISR